MTATPRLPIIDVGDVRPTSSEPVQDPRTSVERYPLTPFVGAMRRGVHEALQDFVCGPASAGGPRAQIAQPRPGGVLTFDLTLAVDDAHEVGLEVFLADSGRRAWFQTRHFAFAYRSAPGADPFAHAPSRTLLERVRTRVTALDASDALTAGSPPAQLLAAIARYAPYAEVGDHMYRQVVAHEHGLAGMLRLGFTCNQDCTLCWQKRTWPEPPGALYEAWLDEMARLGIRQLNLTGGEPTLHKQLPELVQRAVRDYGMSVVLETNAIRLRKPDYLERLRAAGLRDLFVSFHHHDAAKSDAITRAPGTHVGTVAGVRAALEAGLTVTLNCVVDRANCRDLGAHARFVVEHFVRHGSAAAASRGAVASVTYSYPEDYFDHAAYLAHVAPLDEVQPALLDAARALHDAGVPVNLLGTCGFPPCVVREAPRGLWWFDLASVDVMDRGGRAFGPACDHCAMRSRCLGVRKEYLQVYGDRGLVPFREPLVERAGGSATSR